MLTRFSRLVYSLMSTKYIVRTEYKYSSIEEWGVLHYNCTSTMYNCKRIFCLSCVRRTLHDQHTYFLYCTRSTRRKEQNYVLQYVYNKSECQWNVSNGVVVVSSCPPTSYSNMLYCTTVLLPPSWNNTSLLPFPALSVLPSALHHVLTYNSSNLKGNIT